MLEKQKAVHLSQKYAPYYPYSMRCGQEAVNGRRQFEVVC